MVGLALLPELVGRFQAEGLRIESNVHAFRGEAKTMHRSLVLFQLMFITVYLHLILMLLDHR
jgi:hypothetical protein